MKNKLLICLSLYIWRVVGNNNHIIVRVQIVQPGPSIHPPSKKIKVVHKGIKLNKIEKNTALPSL